MSTLIVPKFSEITESPFTRATSDQLQILYTRYDLATKHSVGKDVIEVACGAGVGLGMIAGVGRHVTGGDIDDQNCATALESYAGRPNIEVRHVDALQLPFGACSFDVVVLYEALYYLPSADEFLREARRVLRSAGGPRRRGHRSGLRAGVHQVSFAAHRPAALGGQSRSGHAQGGAVSLERETARDEPRGAPFQSAYVGLPDAGSGFLHGESDSGAPERAEQSPGHRADGGRRSLRAPRFGDASLDCLAKYSKRSFSILKSS